MFNLEKELLKEEIVKKQIDSNSLYTTAIPHSSIFVPSSIYPKFNIDENFPKEVDIATDQIYDFNTNRSNIFLFNLHRYVLDANRSKKRIFPKKTFSNQATKKQKLTETEERILNEYYSEFLEEINTSMKKIKSKYGTSFLLNAHSMTGYTPKVYFKKGVRPAFCIGDAGEPNYKKEFIEKLQEALFYNTKEFRESSNLENKDVLINTPFKGKLGLTKYFTDEEKNYRSLLLEVNQDLYFSEVGNINRNNIQELNKSIGKSVLDALPYLVE